MARIGFFGAGYAGLVSGVCLAELGHTVVIRDIVPERIEALKAGKVPFYEPGVDELIARNADRLSFTLSMDEAVAGSEFLFVCVGTPPTASGDADLSGVWSVVEELPQDLGDVVFVMKSTVPVGTGEKVRAALEARGLGHVGYASCPEFLAEGTAVRDFMESDRVVVGADDEADGNAVAALHEPLGCPIEQMDVPSAEMVKLAANAYLATRVSFINEIANVCELVGADVERVARGMGLDRRIGTHYLRAGIGYGGACFPKDMSFLKLLAGNSGYHFHVVTAVMEVNDLQMRRPVAKLQKYLDGLRGKRIALLGLAFKANTDDLREAPSMVLIARLIAEGAEVVAWDPVATPRSLPRGVELVSSAADAIRGADAAVVVTEWPELRDLPWAELRDEMVTPIVIDGRNHLDGGALRALGFVYEGMGRAAPSSAARARHAGAPGQARREVVEAIILAGGKAERLGDAAAGRPKALVEVGGRPLAAYQVAQLSAAGVERVLVSCAAGKGKEFERALAGIGPEIVAVEEHEPLGRGGGIRLAAQAGSGGDVYALNGDELVDLDFAALLGRHRDSGAAATITVAHPPSPFAIVELADDDRVQGFHEVARMPYWVSCGVYVLGAEALGRFPERGDHETTTFPELVAEGRLGAYRHEGTWITVNTPKDLRRAQDFLAEHPHWLRA